MSTKYLDILIRYTAAGTAEGETAILEEIFVTDNEYIDMITPLAGSPKLLVGKKGTGKSIALQYAKKYLENLDATVLELTPSEINSVAIDVGSVGALTKYYYEDLLRAIGVKIGSKLSGLLRGSEKELYERSIKEGYSSRDWIDKAAHFLPKLANSILKKDIPILPDYAIGTNINLLDAIKDNINSTRGVFYLLFDDTDQIASPDEPKHLNRIWGLLLALRKLCKEVQELRAIITLREEVWRRLMRDHSGQRDQVDHFMPLVQRLSPTVGAVIKIVERRFERAAKATGKFNYNEPSDLFFRDRKVRIPTTKDAYRTWDRMICDRSRGRPRDAIQLINMLARSAKSDGSDQIRESDLASVMHEFSRQRVDYLQKELEVDCDAVKYILDSFAKYDFKEESFAFTADGFRFQLIETLKQKKVRLYGMIMSDSVENIFMIWKFLYDEGIINARISDVTQPHGYRHINPNDEVDLVSARNWNRMQQLMWEIHQAYRDYIIDRASENRHNKGLALKRRKRR